MEGHGRRSVASAVIQVQLCTHGYAKQDLELSGMGKKSFPTFSCPASTLLAMVKVVKAMADVRRRSVGCKCCIALPAMCSRTWNCHDWGKRLLTVHAQRFSCIACALVL